MDISTLTFAVAFFLIALSELQVEAKGKKKNKKKLAKLKKMSKTELNEYNFLCQDYEKYKNQLITKPVNRCQNGATCRVQGGPPNTTKSELRVVPGLGEISCECATGFTGRWCTNWLDYQTDVRLKLPVGKVPLEDGLCKQKCKDGVCKRAVTQRTNKRTGEVTSTKVAYCRCHYDKYEKSLPKNLQDKFCINKCLKKSDCKHDGRCVLVDQPYNHYECVCAEAWTGDHCDKPFTCQRTTLTGKNGKISENKVSPKLNLCQNDGVCKTAGRKSYCICRSNQFTGKFCETFLFEGPSKDFKCLVNGTDICKDYGGECKTADGKEFCDCPAGKQGFLCHEVCKPFTYGEGCTNSCRDRHCSGRKPCDAKSGFCTNDCDFGWGNSDRKAKGDTCDHDEFNRFAVLSQMKMIGRFPPELHNPNSKIFEKERARIKKFVQESTIVQLAGQRRNLWKKIEVELNLLREDPEHSPEDIDAAIKSTKTKNFRELTPLAIDVAYKTAGLNIGLINFKEGSVDISFEVQFPSATAATKDVQGAMTRIMKANADKYNSTLGPGYKIDKNSITVSKPRRVTPTADSEMSVHAVTIVGVVAAVSLLAITVITIYTVRSKRSEASRRRQWHQAYQGSQIYRAPSQGYGRAWSAKQSHSGTARQLRSSQI